MTEEILPAQPKIRVRVDPDLEDLIPGFLENRRKDLQQLNGALKAGDFDVIRTLGHKMKGDGGGYGFQRITEIGAALEQAAKEKRVQEIRRQVVELTGYLDRVEVVYE